MGENMPIDELIALLRLNAKINSVAGDPHNQELLLKAIIGLEKLTAENVRLVSVIRQMRQSEVA